MTEVSGPAEGKSIVISNHAREQVASRGVSDIEVVEAIRSAAWETAGRGRMECRLNRPFASEWNGKHATKQVRPIFVNEPAEIVVVTVYAYYL